jgi:hypothetical protein
MAQDWQITHKKIHCSENQARLSESYLLRLNPSLNMGYLIARGKATRNPLAEASFRLII